MSEICSKLKEYGLTTGPDFETAYIDGEIQILQVQFRHKRVKTSPASLGGSSRMCSQEAALRTRACVRMLEAATEIHRFFRGGLNVE